MFCAPLSLTRGLTANRDLLCSDYCQAMDSRISKCRLLEPKIPPEPVLSPRETVAELERLMELHGPAMPSFKRFHAIKLWLEGEMELPQIIQLVGISRASFYAYRRAYLAEGIAGLNGRGRGRPRKPVSLPLEHAVRQGLRRMSCYHFPTLRLWVRHQGGDCPDWQLRKLAKQSITLNRFKFTESALQYRSRVAWPEEAQDNGQLRLDLEAMDSPGLKPWFDLPNDDWDELFPYMRPSRPLSMPIWRW